MESKEEILDISSIAANWWCDRIKNQTFGSENVFGIDLSFLSSLFFNNDEQIENKLDNFKRIFELIVSSELKKHNYCELSTDFRPYGLLESIEKEAYTSDILFPIMTKMRIFEDKILVSSVFSREYEEIYPPKQKQKSISFNIR